MNLIKVEEIELSHTEASALKLVQRIGDRLYREADNSENRAKGKEIFDACAALEYRYIPEEDNDDEDEVILSSGDLKEIQSFEDLMDKLPSSLTTIINNKCINDYNEGYECGYDYGYHEKAGEMCI